MAWQGIRRMNENAIENYRTLAAPLKKKMAGNSNKAHQRAAAGARGGGVAV